jgi:hypothetical protein
MRIQIQVLCCVLVLVMSAPIMAAEGKFGGTLLGGWAFPTASDPLDGRDGYPGPSSSSFDSTWTLGSEAFFRPTQAFSLGLGVQYWKMVASAARSGGSVDEFISMETIPVYALVRYLRPVEKGLSWHAEAGLGYAFNNGGRESGLDAMSAGMGQSTDPDIDNGICGFLGVGVDYFFNPRLNLGLSLRHWWLEADYDLTASNSGTIEKGVINANNLQVFFGLTYWFGK